MTQIASVLVLLLLVSVSALFAQHGGTAAAGHGSLDTWKWANFLLIAVVLGYVIRKNAGPFFASRSQQIRKAIVEAEEVRADAQKRVAQVDARLANLQSAIEKMRREAIEEQSAEGERVRRQTAADISKIMAQAEQEIASAGKGARLELKRYSARLAVSLAEEKIRASMNPHHQDALVQAFVDNLAQPATPAESR